MQTPVKMLNPDMIFTMSITTSLSRLKVYIKTREAPLCPRLKVASGVTIALPMVEPHSTILELKRAIQV